MRSINGVHLARLMGDWTATSDHWPAYAQLAGAIRLLVLDGRLALSTRLPGERELASALKVSRTTVTAAYDALRTGGYAASRRGSGTWTTIPASHTGTGGVSWAPFTPSGTDLLDLAHASPEALVPALHEAYDAALGQLPRHLPGCGYDLFGVAELRAAVADRFTARGLPTTPEQILITSGAQQAYWLALSAYVDPGDRVLVEHPTYPNALDASRRAHARLVPVAPAENGWDLDAMAAALQQTSPRLAYLVPDYNNPTGLLVSDAERAAAARHLERSRTLTVVDETLVELALTDGSAPAPFASYLPRDLGVTVGSASKVFWGGLRVGWVRAEPGIIRQLAAIRATVDMASSVVEQLAVLHLLNRVDELAAERRAELRRRRDGLVGALAEHLPDWRVRVPRGGLVLWCDIGAPVSSALVSAAERHGLRLASGPRFGVDGAFERRLRLPYTYPVDVLADAVARLAAAYQSVASQDVAPPPPLASLV